ncbi:hypothetical protein DFH09DRAFT_1475387 [Mycena vulgaris]|nr:hypothetical protein DFH09DRAFT_1475387 [Mycena vulgaris]
MVSGGDEGEKKDERALTARDRGRIGILGITCRERRNRPRRIGRAEDGQGVYGIADLLYYHTGIERRKTVGGKWGAEVKERFGAGYIELRQPPEITACKGKGAEWACKFPRPNTEIVPDVHLYRSRSLRRQKMCISQVWFPRLPATSRDPRIRRVSSPHIELNQTIGWSKAQHREGGAGKFFIHRVARALLASGLGLGLQHFWRGKIYGRAILPGNERPSTTSPLHFPPTSAAENSPRRRIAVPPTPLDPHCNFWRFLTPISGLFCRRRGTSRARVDWLEVCTWWKSFVWVNCGGGVAQPRRTIRRPETMYSRPANGLKSHLFWWKILAAGGRVPPHANRLVAAHAELEAGARHTYATFFWSPSACAARASRTGSALWEEASRAAHQRQFTLSSETMYRRLASTPILAAGGAVFFRGEVSWIFSPAPARASDAGFGDTQRIPDVNFNFLPLRGAGFKTEALRALIQVGFTEFGQGSVACAGKREAAMIGGHDWSNAIPHDSVLIDSQNREAPEEARPVSVPTTGCISGVVNVDW